MAILTKNVKIEVLFNLISEGNELAFKILFEEYKSKAHAVAYKCTRSVFAAEEIIQEVFISIWISRLQLSVVKNPEAYIYTIIYNNTKRYLKKEKN